MGGVVSETSFKFFIQFVVYTAVFCVFVLIVCAYFTAEIRRDVSDHWRNAMTDFILLTLRKTGGANAHWAVCLGL